MHHHQLLALLDAALACRAEIIIHHTQGREALSMLRVWASSRNLTIDQREAKSPEGRIFEVYAVSFDPSGYTTIHGGCTIFVDPTALADADAASAEIGAV